MKCGVSAVPEGGAAGGAGVGVPRTAVPPTGPLSRLCSVFRRPRSTAIMHQNALRDRRRRRTGRDDRGRQAHSGELSRLQKMYGRGRWRKLKGMARIRVRGGAIRKAELHWYEAHGIGRKEIKRKRYLD